MNRAAVLALASLLPLTSGCVVAAIPIAAGAALAKRHSDLEDRAAKPAAVAETSARSDLAVVPTELTALPPPDPVAGRGNRAVAAFGEYAGEIAQAQPGLRKRESALLASASDLRASRVECGARASAVFVDLDPGRASFDPLAPGVADAELGRVLAKLREQGIRVVWFSRLGENFAGAARAALAGGGLDPAGEDELVLMRDIGERKQTRRDEIAAQWCPIAMLGDERADFDELFLYLKNPDSAVTLDAMINRGWFLASPFASPQVMPNSGATP